MLPAGHVPLGALRALFVNFEDFEWAIAERAGRDDGADPWFFSGYDCDSLALEAVTGFMLSD